MGWTPAVGARALLERLGDTATTEVLVRLLAGEAASGDLAWTPYRRVLLDIGDGHAERLMSDESGRRLAYWPRVWAARALGYVGDQTSGKPLLSALADVHWRVRMMATQSIGVLGLHGATRGLLERLDDEHPRVRSAAILALERVGGEEAIERLLQGAVETERHRVERAVARILERTTGQ